MVVDHAAAVVLIAAGLLANRQYVATDVVTPRESIATAPQARPDSPTGGAGALKRTQGGR